MTTLLKTDDVPTFCIVCQTCKEKFRSSKRRQFCSVKCRARSPLFRRQILENLQKARQAYIPTPKMGESRPCVQCEKEIYLTRTMIARGAKFCSRACYRAWMADRFDRNIGAIDTVEQLSNYDEFLSRDRLACLIPGCGWSGDDLSLHMNLHHGIAADDFKKKAGFNKSTGVISAPMARNLEKRGNKGNTETLSASRPTRTGEAQETRKEALEHLKKAAILRVCVKDFLGAA